MSWRGIFAGALALIALEAVVRTNESANRVGSGLGWAADLVTAALSPATPAVPDLAGIAEEVPDEGSSSDHWYTNPFAPPSGY